MARNPSTIAVIDLGTYRCCCLVAQVAGPKQLDVVGIGSSALRNMRP